MSTSLVVVAFALATQLDAASRPASNSLELTYRKGPQEILSEDPTLKAAADNFERDLGKPVEEVITKTRTVQRTIYTAVEQRYGLFGRKCRIVYVPQTVQEQQNYQETRTTIKAATLLATVPDGEAGRGDARADFRTSPPPLEALAKRIRIQLAQFAASAGQSLTIQQFVPLPNAGPDNVVIAEPGQEVRYSQIVGIGDLPQDVQTRLQGKRVAYSVIARIDELNDNRVVYLIVRVAFDSSSGAGTVTLSDANLAAQKLADRLRTELAPAGP